MLIQANQVNTVVLRGVAKSFRTPRGTVHAVRRIDLSAAPGEAVALLGPNGAGKSTSIDMLLGLTPPDRGSVRLLGRPPREAIDAGLVGVMLQTGALVRDVSVRELVVMMASLYPHPLPVDDVLEAAGVTGIAEQRSQMLSCGQTERVRLALALTSNPELLVLDEPTVGMEVESRRAFWGSMRAFVARGKTVIFATHYLQEADAYADRAVLMAEGRVVADGPTTEIRARAGRRTIRATLPDADLAAVRWLAGVAAVERRGGAVVLSCSDSDAAIRALLWAYPGVRDIEIASAGLDDALLHLTGGADEPAAGELVGALR
ncbi:MAG TPA: ABC transporter ATP-binding protein [Jatrophihabitantaceae bacterium]